LRVKGTQLRPARQFTEAGIELMGSDSAAADVEIVTLAVSALESVGVNGLSADLTMPTLVPAVCAASGLSSDAETRIKAALNRRDAAGVAAAGGSAAPILLKLLGASGPAESALATLSRLSLPESAAAECRRLTEGAARIAKAMPALSLTIDPVEHRGFEYHSGMSFTLFANGARGEMGRGGRYRAGGEPATGATLFVDAVLDSLPRGEAWARVFVPVGISLDEAERLRREGWITVCGLEEIEPTAEAKRLRCTHVFLAGKIAALS